MKDDLVDLLAHDRDEPLPPEHEAKIREGLGALLAGASPSPPPADPAMSAATKGGLTKLVTVGLVVAAAGGGFLAGRATASREASVPTSPSVIATLAPVTAPPVTAAATTSSVATTPSSSAQPVATASSAHATPSGASSGDAFDREQSLLERARSALVRHDAAEAERALDESTRMFPRSHHVEERDYLRIQVLRERGDETGARSRARAFLDKYPDSLFRARVETIAR